MMLGTHACLPLAAAALSDIFLLKSGRETFFTNWHLAFVAIAGMLPDLLWPHMRLNERLTSPTHTIWFLISLFIVVYPISRRLIKEKSLVFTLAFVAAAASHIFLDAISGGISLFYPYRHVWGIVIIPWKYWLYCDGALILIASLLLILRRKLSFLKLVRQEQKK